MRIRSFAFLLLLAILPATTLSQEDPETRDDDEAVRRIRLSTSFRGTQRRQRIHRPRVEEPRIITEPEEGQEAVVFRPSVRFGGRKLPEEPKVITEPEFGQEEVVFRTINRSPTEVVSEEFIDETPVAEDEEDDEGYAEPEAVSTEDEIIYDEPENVEDEILSSGTEYPPIPEEQPPHTNEAASPEPPSAEDVNTEEIPFEVLYPDNFPEDVSYQEYPLPYEVSPEFLYQNQPSDSPFYPDYVYSHPQPQPDVLYPQYPPLPAGYNFEATDEVLREPHYIDDSPSYVNNENITYDYYGEYPEEEEGFFDDTPQTTTGAVADITEVPQEEMTTLEAEEEEVTTITPEVQTSISVVTGKPSVVRGDPIRMETKVQVGNITMVNLKELDKYEKQENKKKQQLKVDDEWDIKEKPALPKNEATVELSTTVATTTTSAPSVSTTTTTTTSAPSVSTTKTTISAPSVSATTATTTTAPLSATTIQETTKEETTDSTTQEEVIVETVTDDHVLEDTTTYRTTNIVNDTVTNIPMDETTTTEKPPLVTTATPPVLTTKPPKTRPVLENLFYDKEASLTGKDLYDYVGEKGLSTAETAAKVERVIKTINGQQYEYLYYFYYDDEDIPDDLADDSDIIYYNELDEPSTVPSSTTTARTVPSTTSVPHRLAPLSPIYTETNRFRAEKPPPVGAIVVDDSRLPANTRFPPRLAPTDRPHLAPIDRPQFSPLDRPHSPPVDRPTAGRFIPSFPVVPPGGPVQFLGVTPERIPQRPAPPPPPPAPSPIPSTTSTPRITTTTTTTARPTTTSFLPVRPSTRPPLIRTTNPPIQPGRTNFRRPVVAVEEEVETPFITRIPTRPPANRQPVEIPDVPRVPSKPVIRLPTKDDELEEEPSVPSVFPSRTRFRQPPPVIETTEPEEDPIPARLEPTRTRFRQPVTTKPAEAPLPTRNRFRLPPAVTEPEKEPEQISSFPSRRPSRPIITEPEEEPEQVSSFPSRRPSRPVITEPAEEPEQVSSFPSRRPSRPVIAEPEEEPEQVSSFPSRRPIRPLITEPEDEPEQISSFPSRRPSRPRFRQPSVLEIGTPVQQRPSSVEPTGRPKFRLPVISTTPKPLTTLTTPQVSTNLPRMSPSQKSIFNLYAFSQAAVPERKDTNKIPAKVDMQDIPEEIRKDLPEGAIVQLVPNINQFRGTTPRTTPTQFVTRTFPQDSRRPGAPNSLIDSPVFSRDQQATTVTPSTTTTQKPVRIRPSLGPLINLQDTPRIVKEEEEKEEELLKTQDEGPIVHSSTQSTTAATEATTKSGTRRIKPLRRFRTRPGSRRRVRPTANRGRVTEEKEEEEEKKEKVEEVEDEPQPSTAAPTRSRGRKRYRPTINRESGNRFRFRPSSRRRGSSSTETSTGKTETEEKEEQVQKVEDEGLISEGETTETTNAPKRRTRVRRPGRRGSNLRRILQRRKKPVASTTTVEPPPAAEIEQQELQASTKVEAQTERLIIKEHVEEVEQSLYPKDEEELNKYTEDDSSQPEAEATPEEVEKEEDEEEPVAEAEAEAEPKPEPDIEEEEQEKEIKDEPQIDRTPSGVPIAPRRHPPRSRLSLYLRQRGRTTKSLFLRRNKEKEDEEETR